MGKNTREMIIEAAAMLFADKGLDGVSLAEVAMVAGVSDHVVTELFLSVMNLYGAVLETEFNLYATRMDTVFDSDASPTEKVVKFAQAMCEVHRQAPHFFTLFYRELLTPSPYFETIVRQRIRHVAYLSDNNIAKGIQKGMFKHGVNPANITMLLAGMFHYFFLASRLAPSLLPEPVNGEEYFSQALKILMTGLNEQT